MSGISSVGNSSVAAMWQQHLKDADSDGNGKISKSEFTQELATMQKKGGGSGPNSDDMFAELDANSDGSIDESEFAAHESNRKANFAKIMEERTAALGTQSSSADVWQKILSSNDSDGDGKISQSEFEKAAQSKSSASGSSDVLSSLMSILGQTDSSSTNSMTNFSSFLQAQIANYSQLMSSTSSNSLFSVSA